MGKHSGNSSGSGNAGGKHESTDKDKPATGGSKTGTPATTGKNSGKGK
jgi:hypothetical protein